VPQITVEEMCSEMVSSDLDIAKQHAILKSHGYNKSVAVE
jgi:GDPmannose 4,6-dehydratase